MRSAELLNALAQTRGGIKVDIRQTGVLVTLNYAPWSFGAGKTLMDASIRCAKQLLKALEDYPVFKSDCPDVLKALEAYDLHSFYLSQ
jgi:hypothetical protein